MIDENQDTPAARYVKDRLLPQIAWLEAKAGQNKQRFVAMNAIPVTLPLMVPLLNLAGKDQPYLIAAAICGALASAAAFSIRAATARTGRAIASPPRRSPRCICATSTASLRLTAMTATCCSWPSRKT